MTVPIFNASNDRWTWKNSMIVKSGIRRSERLQRHLAWPQRKRRDARQLAEAHRFGEPYCSPDTKILERPNGGAITRRSKSRADAHRRRRGVLVVRCPRALRRRDRLVEVVEDCGWRV